VNAATRDIALGIAALAVAGTWWALAAAIPVSLLADAVGPGGVPKAMAMLMAAAGAVLVLRSVLRPTQERPARPAHGRAAGLLALLTAYVLALPLIGYPLALGLLAGRSRSMPGRAPVSGSPASRRRSARCSGSSSCG
jgi:hypothetical protein